jgi:hypothetical protein
MFRVLDDRPGSSASVSVAGAGPLRVRAHVQASADPADLTGLRVLLTADLLARAGELAGLQVFTARAITGKPADEAAVERAAAALGIHPPVLPAADPAGTWPGGQAHVHVADEGYAVEDNLGGVLVRAATARLVPDADPGGAAAGTLGGHDPLTVRLALVSVPRRQPAGLTADDLVSAAQRLGEWRRRVAGWAEFPSGAIPEAAAATFRTAFVSLDTTAVLALLNGMAADETLPPGPRFETFVYADRVLGLDLPRDIGR